ncbi:MAG: hypothetical protein J7559_04380, partial [Cohnella sp.]|nr:hypothetical protein [Cohnella sp.]
DASGLGGADPVVSGEALGETAGAAPVFDAPLPPPEQPASAITIAREASIRSSLLWSFMWFHFLSYND